MWSYLHHLPPIIVGTHVLGYLCLKDLVELDNALFQRKYRTDFLSILPYCPPININHYPNLIRNKTALAWFYKRHCSIAELEIVLSEINNTNFNNELTKSVILRMDRIMTQSDINILNIYKNLTSIDILVEQETRIMEQLLILCINLL